MLSSSFRSIRQRVRWCSAGLAVFFLLLPTAATAQSLGRIEGRILDPSGAAIPGAQVTLSGAKLVRKVVSRGDGTYFVGNVPAGTYRVTVSAQGFMLFSQRGISVATGQVRHLNPSLVIAVEQQQVTVDDDIPGVGLGSDQNASAMVIKGRNLDALSDDPDQLQKELQALAGPAAGPNGGQIYIDGFTGGQLPPKSSILEVRVNQNPFSAEFDRIGYGRIEVVTKPGTQKLHGSVSISGTNPALNTANPLIPSQAPYAFYTYLGNLGGPVTRSSSYFLDLLRISRRAENIVNAVNPQNTSENLREAYPNTWELTIGSARLDFQAGERNTLTVRGSYWRQAQTGNDVGTLNLPSQASNSLYQENTVQVGDTILMNGALVNEFDFRWRRLHNSQSAMMSTPTVSVLGSFTDGGNSAGTVQDQQNDFEFRDSVTATAGNNTLRFGADAQIYRDANYSTSGENGTYIFTNLSDYKAGHPALYTATLITNPLVRATVAYASLYVQDDWRINPNIVLGFGLRYEGQNWIADHNDWAPRISFAWSPWHTDSVPAKTILRAGYGWFYNRFSVPTSFDSFAGTPYVIEVLHDNLVNQRSYTISNPGFYNPHATEPSSIVTAATASVPTYHSIDPHFHSAIDIQTGIGLDRQLTNGITGNISYLYTRGVHQYLSNNATAPAFDPATYKITGPIPAIYNYQFQSGGVYRESQIITSVSAQLRHLSLHANYTYATAKSDTQGPTSFPSVASDPRIDYGRAIFDIRHQTVWMASYAAPKAVTIAAEFFARSGVPYNLTIGSDLTGNNQFNARPAYGTCGALGVVTTQYGCLDTNPAGKNERLMPYGAGTGPANSILILRASKVIGIGPRLRQESDNDQTAIQSSNSVQGRGLSGGGAAIHLDAAAPRIYSLTLAMGVTNVLNQVNFAPPNGVLQSPLFNQTQSLAAGEYSNPIPGNRMIMFQSSFSF